jgi:uncharacterized membrane protein
MPDTYCVQCGAVNQPGYHYCVGCGSYFGAQPTSAATAEPRKWTTAPPPDWQPFRNPLVALRGIGSFSVNHVLALTLRQFGEHLWLISKLVFLVVAPFEIFKVMTLAQAPPDWQTISLALLLGATCNVLITPALIYAFMKNLETGVAPGVNESFRWGLTKIGRLALCAAISGVLQILGYALCVIPGIIVTLSLVLVYPVAVLEKGSPEDVLKRSSQLTRGHRWEILGAEIVLGLLALAVTGPASLLISNIKDAPQAMELTVFLAIVKDIAEQATTVLSLMMYLTLVRTPRPGNSILSLTN